MSPLNLEKIEQKVHKGVGRALEFEGVCFRNVKQKYANQQDILSAAGSLITGGRFNVTVQVMDGSLFVVSHVATYLAE